MITKYIAFLYKDDDSDAYNINIPDLEDAALLRVSAN